MIKAFLSHSHEDAELVRAVANKIGRALVHIDVNSFQTADDLIAAMERAVRESAVFVFFASTSSMSSAWVNFEMREARYHQAVNRIRKLVVVILDDRLVPGDFPGWMRRSKFLTSRSPAPIAREIRYAIDELVQDQQHSLFVGRASETAELQAAFVPPDTSSGVPLVTVKGLPGIGRRTLVRRVARDTLSMPRIIEVRVEAGDNENSIAVKLADLVEPAVTPDQTLATARSIAALNPSDAVNRFLKDLEISYGNNELIVLYDAGGLLDNAGLPTQPIRLLVSDISRRRDLMIVLVTNRRPLWREVPEVEDVAVVDVGPLRPLEMRQLIALSAKAQEVALSAGETGELAEQAHGYPPAARLLVSLVKTYGVHLALGKTESEYQPRPLARYLRSLTLQGPERDILRILARNSPLPADLILSFANSKHEGIEALSTLIDASLVMPMAGTSWYKISDPIVSHVEKQYGACTAEEYAKVVDGLQKVLSEDRESGPYLELSRVLYRALIHAGLDQNPQAFAMVADWLRLAEEFYHQRDYQKSLEMSQLAYEAGRTRDALPWLIKARVKLGEYSVALEDIEKLRQQGEVKEAHFLRGFLERDRSRHHEAIKHYELARSAGRGGLALERDLAECCLQVGDIDRASTYIERAQERQPDNPYVVSLRIKIACRQGDEPTARQLLNLLNEVDNPTFVAHRHSRVELQFGTTEDAYQWAKKAVDSTARPPIEAISNFAACEILTHRLAEANGTIERIQSIYGNRRLELQSGLRARLAIAEKKFEDALGYCAKLSMTDNPIHIKLKRDALQGLLSHTNMSSTKRAELEAEVARLDYQLADKYSGMEWDIEPE